MKGWNISENFIAEKEVNDNEPWEFGYALAASRPLSLKGSAKAVYLLPPEFRRWGGALWRPGDAYDFGLRQTEQYLGPTVALNTPHGLTFKFSPEFGLNDNSVGVLWRFGVSYEISAVS